MRTYVNTAWPIAWQERFQAPAPRQSQHGYQASARCRSAFTTHPHRPFGVVLPEISMNHKATVIPDRFGPFVAGIAHHLLTTPLENSPSIVLKVYQGVSRKIQPPLCHTARRARVAMVLRHQAHSSRHGCGNLHTAAGGVSVYKRNNRTRGAQPRLFCSPAAPPRTAPLCGSCENRFGKTSRPMSAALA